LLREVVIGASDGSLSTVSLDLGLAAWHRILVEISSRSLRDTFKNKGIIYFIGAKYNGRPFVGEIIYVPTVLPIRTFLEKLFSFS